MVVDKNYLCGELDAEAVYANMSRVHDEMRPFPNTQYTTKDVRQEFERACRIVQREMEGSNGLPKE